MIAVACVRCVK